MKQTKIPLLTLLTVLTVLTLASTVFAETTILSPNSTDTSVGTIILSVNATDQEETYPGALANITWYAKSALTNDTDWAVIALNTSVNLTLHGNISTVAFDSTNLEDANNWVFNVTIINVTGTAATEPIVTNSSATSANIIIDNTNPTAASALLPTTDSDNTVNFSATVTDAETTSCSLVFSGINPGAANYTMVYSGSSCSAEVTNVPEQSYTWLVRASDESNHTDSSTQTTNIQTPSGNAANLINQGAIPVGGNQFQIQSGVMGTTLGIPNWILLIIGIIVVVSLVRRKR